MSRVTLLAAITALACLSSTSSAQCPSCQRHSQPAPSPVYQPPTFVPAPAYKPATVPAVDGCPSCSKHRVPPAQVSPPAKAVPHEAEHACPSCKKAKPVPPSRSKKPTVVILGCTSCGPCKVAHAYFTALKKKWDYFEVTFDTVPEGWDEAIPGIFILRNPEDLVRAHPSQVGFDTDDIEALRRLHAELDRIVRAK